MVAMPPRVGGSSKALSAPPSQPALLPIPTSGAPFYSHHSLLFPDHAVPAPASGLCASWASAQVLPGPCRPRTHLAGSLGPSSLCSHVTHGLEETIPPTPQAPAPRLLFLLYFPPWHLTMYSARLLFCLLPPQKCNLHDEGTFFPVWVTGDPTVPRTTTAHSRLPINTAQ